MKFTKVAMLAAALSVSLGVTAGATNAAPPADSDAGVINYSTTHTETQTVIKTDAGSMVVEDGVFKVKAADGTTVAGTELKFRVDDFEFPITAEIADRTATLTPRFDVAHAVYKPVALPYEDKAPWKNEYDREVAAWSRLGSTISLGASIATLVGGLGGAAIASATIVGMFGPFIPAAAVGCIAGMGAIGFLGTLIGQIFITAPVAIMAAVQYFTTVNSPFPGK
ncbi:hypothetical protein H0264_13930 [Nocardia huaxiensis]|uniref:DUF8020 domain-containing protein n=1 Tax=Nocardia huaxiensis TaxID=2755382 RepID=A0A7D6VHS4_9NOCA|nr:hypothetical protein [Nocardia huaxiensis]QLY33177.1 hypothetical protein H0264_13930 [Nocardia huaxiensis]